MIWPVARPTARSAMKESSVSPDLWLVMIPHPASLESRTCTGPTTTAVGMQTRGQTLLPACADLLHEKRNVVLASHKGLNNSLHDIA